jgi:hypothetical protein
MKLLTTILLLVSSSTFAAKHMAYLGGSGDPAGATTLFDSKIPVMASYARASGYETRVAFDGGHSTTEQLLANNFSDAIISDFTYRSYETTISEYERQIRNGQIPSGDQLMVIVDTHGSRRNSVTATHTVAAGRGPALDLEQLSGSDTVTLDRLQSLARLAQEKNIKLAIVDFSCHSGASLPLGNSHTCVVTATGPESYGYGGSDSRIFANILPKKMRPGKNLEDAFLEARNESNDMGFAMISSPAGKAVQDRLYPLLQRYINSREKENDKFSYDIMESVKTGSCEKENDDVQQILSLSREMEAATAGLDLGPLRNAVNEYHQYRQTMQQELRNMGVNRLNETIPMCGVPQTGCIQLSIDLILVMDADRNLAEYQRQLATSRSQSERDRNQKWIVYFENVKAKKAELLRTNPGFARYTTFLQTYPNLQLRTAVLARKVAVESRKMYSTLYQQNRSQNACRDFIL